MVGRVGPDVGQREVGLAAQLAGLHAVEPPRLAGGGDVMAEVGRLPGQLGGRHHELLHRQREEAAPDEGHGQVAADRQSAVAGQLPPHAADHHGDRGEQRQHRRDPQRRQPGVHVGVAGADQRAGGRVEQAGDLHQPEPEGGEEKQRREQDGQVQPRRRLDREPPGGPGRRCRRGASRAAPAAGAR